MSTQRVLIADDDSLSREFLSEACRSFGLHVEAVTNGEQALERLRRGGLDLVLTDMRMPGMSGVEFLATAKEKWPDTVRMMLTGNADQDTAVAAVNHGDIFRFLNKPCEPELLEHAVSDGIRQHQLITAERDLLQNTLKGSITALAEILSLTNPEIFGHTTRYRRLMARLATQLGIGESWELESTALIAQLGCVSIARELVTRKIGGHPLPPDEMEEFAGHAKIGADLLSTIPRMDAIAESIRYQERNFDGSGYPAGLFGDEIHPYARICAIADVFDAVTTLRTYRDPIRTFDALRMMRSEMSTELDMELLAEFVQVFGH